jgi:hypothetical protein
MKHEAVKDTGSFKVRFQNGRPSKFFYWDDVPSRRLHPDMLTSETGAGAGVRLGRTGQGITFTGAFNAGLHARQPVVLHTCLLEWVKLIVTAVPISCGMTPVALGWFAG